MTEKELRESAIYNLIKLRLNNWGDPQHASIKYYAESRRITGGLRQAIIDMVIEHVDSLPCQHPFDKVVQNGKDIVCFKCGHKW